MNGARKLFYKACVTAATVLIALTMVGSVAFAKKTIIFGDGGWDTIRIHNHIAGFIIEHGMGYDYQVVTANTAIMVESLIRGDIDVDMESWTQNIQEQYDRGISEGKMVDLGPNIPDSWQGWFPPMSLRAIRNGASSPWRRT